MLGICTGSFWDEADGISLSTNWPGVELEVRRLNIFGGGRGGGDIEVLLVELEGGTEVEPLVVVVVVVLVSFSFLTLGAWLPAVSCCSLAPIVESLLPLCDFGFARSFLSSFNSLLLTFSSSKGPSGFNSSTGFS